MADPHAELGQAVSNGLSGTTLTTGQVDLQASVLIGSLSIPDNETAYLSSNEQVGVIDLSVGSGATFIVDGEVEVFGNINDDGTITGSGTVSLRSV